MSFDQKPRNYSHVAAHAHGTDIDVGLQAHMQKVYKVMMYGLGVTGAVAYAIANIPALYNLFLGTPLFYVAAFAPLAIVWFGFSPKRAFGMSKEKLRGMFYLLSILYGVSFAAIFAMFTPESLARVFFITAATFGGMSLLGYTTKRDLTSLGSFLFMGVIGIIFASLANFFIGSDMVHFIVSVLAVAIFTLMIAVDTQRIKEQYSYAHGDGDNDKMATLGALSLYINFVVIFMNLASLLGDQR